MPTETLTLRLDGMAHGGAALGRDARGRVVFVPLAIPGEKVRAAATPGKGRYAQGRLLAVLERSPERREPRCPHFGVCGTCHFQHLDYAAQLKYKMATAADQLQRVGKLRGAVIRPILPNPQPWDYLTTLTFSPTAEGRAGLWSPLEGRVIPIQVCHILHPQLNALLTDLDLGLPTLRSLTLRRGADGARLLALTTTDAEAPELEMDVAVSVALVLPDGLAANLVGESYLWQQVQGRAFRVSAGAFFHPSPPSAGLLVDAVLRYAALRGGESVLEGYSGVGMLTAFLAQQARAVTGIESNADAVDDAAYNLAETDNVALFNDWIESVLPALTERVDLMVIDPPADGPSAETVAAIIALAPPRLVISSHDVAGLAHLAPALQRGGYRLVEVQPLDMLPQTFYVHCVSLWQRTGSQ